MAKKHVVPLRVPYALAVHGKDEEKRVMNVMREHRTLMGQETDEFEKKVAKIFGSPFAIMVNSGSSANLVAVELLGLPEGSEVITPVLTFSTTVAPLLMKRLVPVFTDVDEGTYLMNLDQVEKAITKNTKALMIPFLLGNVPDISHIVRIAKKHKLAVIFDSCDTLGATYNGKKVGVYADVSTTSFYGSHIITAGGGGGMVVVNTSGFRDRAKTLRGWGRGSALINESESIEKRFQTKINNIPYDAKFVFTEIGYNFMPMEMGSAFGNAQLDKLPIFRKTREGNYKTLLLFFQKYQKYFILPKQDKKVRTQWLAFPLVIRKDAPFTRLEICTYLENNNVQTRPIFTGVITKQPGFSQMKFKSLLKSFPVSEHIMQNGFLVGCHQGMEKKHTDRLKEVFTAFFQEKIQ